MWTFVFIAAVLGLWLLYRKRNFTALKELGIPGPEPNLIFGNLWEITKKGPIQCHKEWFEKYGKIVGYYFGTKPTVLIADVDLLKRIQVSEFHKFMNRPNIFSSRDTKPGSQRVEGFSNQLIVLRDKRWKEVRSILTPSFTTSKMKQMAPVMNNTIDTLLKNVEKKSLLGESFNLMPMYQGLTMDIIGRTAFGIQTNVQNDPNEPFLRSSRILLSGDISNVVTMLAVSFRSLTKFWSWVNRLRLSYRNQGTNPVAELIRSVKNVIAARREQKERRPDLLQLMIDAKVDDTLTVSADDLTATDEIENVVKQTTGSSVSKTIRQMSDDDILDNSLIFFLAGYETTSTALAFTTHFLIQYPEVQEKIREEVQQLLKSEGELDYYSVNKLQYLDQVLNESLRLYPPVYLFVNRECGEDIDFGSFRLAKGMSIQVPVYHLQRDPELWSNPEEFRPERFAPENKSKHHPLAFQAFGAGPRNCVGMRFALMEAKLTIAKLLAKYRFKACPETEKEPITLKISFAALKPKHGVWTKAVPV